LGKKANPDEIRA